MWWFNGGAHWGWMAVGMVWMFLFWGSIVWLAVWGLRSISGRGPGGNSARGILDERYARGEISREQYEQMKKDIGV